MTLKISIYNLVIITLLSFSSCIKDSKNKPNSFNNNIEDVLNNQMHSWNKGDIKGFMEGYEKSDSLQFITRKGRTMGWQSVSDNYTKHYPSTKEMGHLNFKNLIVKNLSDSLAQVYGNWELLKDSTVGGNFSLVLKHKPEGWKIIIDHTW
jgi:hypothetical protein